MSVSGASGSSGASGASTSNSSSASSVESQYQVFLTMLTTELQNQDPTQPLDSSQFTSQLAQFSGLEQQLQTNSLLTTIANDQTSNSIGGALGYIGHTIEATGDQFTLPGVSSTSNSGTSNSGSDGSSSTDNSAPLAFALASAGQSATITIVNSGGQTVNTVTVSNPTAGNNTYDFNGEDSTGTPLPAGTYTFSVTATDSSGNSIDTTTFTTAKVTGLMDTDGTAELVAGGLQIPAANVVEVTA
jgi:flagellar basal-body rod modification protein FlgD